MYFSIQLLNSSALFSSFLFSNSSLKFSLCSSSFLLSIFMIITLNSLKSLLPLVLFLRVISKKEYVSSFGAYSRLYVAQFSVFTSMCLVRSDMFPAPGLMQDTSYGVQQHAPLVTRNTCSRGARYVSCVYPSVVTGLTTVGALAGEADSRPSWLRGHDSCSNCRPDRGWGRLPKWLSMWPGRMWGWCQTQMGGARYQSSYPCSRRGVAQSWCQLTLGWGQILGAYRTERHDSKMALPVLGSPW